MAAIARCLGGTDHVGLIPLQEIPSKSLSKNPAIIGGGASDVCYLELDVGERAAPSAGVGNARRANPRFIYPLSQVSNEAENQKMISGMPIKRHIHHISLNIRPFSYLYTLINYRIKSL